MHGAKRMKVSSGGAVVTAVAEENEQTRSAARSQGGGEPGTAGPSVARTTASASVASTAAATGRGSATASTGAGTVGASDDSESEVGVGEDVGLGVAAGSSSGAGVLDEAVMDPSQFPELDGEFDVLHRIGQGTFSTVYKARHRGTGLVVALKRIRATTAPWRTFNELGYLIHFGGREYVTNVHKCLRREDQVTLILPYFEHRPFYKYVSSMTLHEVAVYMKALMVALRYIHTENVLHRDVKPSNFLHNPETGQFMLIDFGLADLASVSEDAHKGNVLLAKIATNMQRAKLNRVAAATKEYEREAAKRSARSSKRKRSLTRAAREATQASGASTASTASSSSASGASKATGPIMLGHERLAQLQAQGNDRKRARVAARAGTRGFRAPEVLLRVEEQTTAIDVWSAGVILLCMLLRKYPVFHSPDDLTALCEITLFCGSREMVAAAAAMNRVFRPESLHPRVDLKDLVVRCVPDFGAPELARQLDDAIQLLEACLELDPARRVTAADALDLPFLANVEAPPLPPD
ncbi:CDC7 protein kinase [Thecamonas trahens ATCC 50062]|uniref:CDC7 protein kinase n=1 Tax=Thecamonas trahens ATCC 50062 TaxID=461836 RepID=A0A0L0D949_THETB|nr:CDC7 protein kinase [Thecamonas trahens ATCC 50062]KNC48912.1 CDC7 protein kinase [Thecamonas trahens ATCC 50062]|eukprot:XP_013758329.1 CDC7 protein kinase [Thecamonas trahens ATCC 50062]